MLLLAQDHRSTPDRLLRRYALQDSKCRFWCRLRGSASFISPLNWTEVGPNQRSGRYGTTKSIVWGHTSWCAFWPMCCGRRSRPAVTNPNSAMNRGKCLQSFRRLLWSMWFCPRANGWRNASAAPVNRRSTNGSCYNGSACGCP
jgi:hypothetical protein